MLNRETNRGYLDELRQFGEEVVRRLEAIAEHTEAGMARQRYRYVRNTLVVPAASTEVSESIGPPQGAAWLIERTAAVSTSGAATSQLEIYLGNIDPPNLVELIAIGAGGKAVQAAGNNIYVPVGAQLTIRFFGQAAGVANSYNMRVKELFIEDVE